MEFCDSDTVFMVIGGKIDEAGADFAHANGCLHFEVSAKTGEGVEESLDTMLREILSVVKSRKICAARPKIPASAPGRFWQKRN
jgi:hypothetical protein